MLRRLSLIMTLFGIWFMASWWIWQPGFFRVHDFTQAARVAEMSRSLSDGHFPVRWSQNFGFGYGMPLFEFYASLPYYFGGVLFLAGLNEILVMKVMFSLSSLVTLWGSYEFLKRQYGVWVGILGATLVTLAPYRAVNLYVRGALSEAWGMMWLPIIMLGVSYVLDSPTTSKKAFGKGWWLLFLGVFGVLTSHNLTALMALPLLYGVSLVWLGWKWWQRLVSNPVSHFFQITLSFLLGAALSSFYFIPALLEKDYTRVSAIFSGYFEYSNHFLFIRQFFTPFWGYGGSAWGPEDGISFFLGWGQWLGLVAAGLSMIYFILTQRAKKPIFQNWAFISAVGWLSILGLSLFLSLERSAVVWHAIPVLSYLQFPWRWLTVAACALGWGVAAAVSLLPQKWQKWLCVGLIIITAATSSRIFHPEKQLLDLDIFYGVSAEHIQREISTTLPDYVPVQMAEELSLPPASVWISSPTTEGQIFFVTRNAVHSKEVMTYFTQLTTLEFAVANFPGWRAKLDGQEIALSEAKLGNLQLQVPAGEHTILVEFGSTPVRLVSDALSLTALGVVLALGLWQTRFKKNYD